MEYWNWRFSNFFISCQTGLTLVVWLSIISGPSVVRSERGWSFSINFEWNDKSIFIKFSEGKMVFHQCLNLKLVGSLSVGHSGRPTGVDQPLILVDSPRVVYLFITPHSVYKCRFRVWSGLTQIYQGLIYLRYLIFLELLNSHVRDKRLKICWCIQKKKLVLSKFFRWNGFS